MFSNARALRIPSLLLVLLLTPAIVSAATYTVGDVFASVGNGQVKEFTPTGVLVQTLNTGLGGFTTGSAFDSSGNLYVTNFSSGSISKFDNNGVLVSANFVVPGGSPESISFAKDGTFYVGNASTNQIKHYTAAGVLIGTVTVSTERRGTDWIDLQADQSTLLYTSEGSDILSFNSTTNTQNPNVTSALPGSSAYALRALGDGTILVADSGADYRVSAVSGTILQTYLSGANGNSGGLFSLNLDPNGTSFWTGDFNSSNIWEVNIATGAVQNFFNAGTNALFGLSVFGEISQGTGEPVPEPSTIVLIASGLGAAAWRRLKMRG